MLIWIKVARGRLPLTAIKAGSAAPRYRGSVALAGTTRKSMANLRAPEWILIANATRARVLQRDAGMAMEVLESFIHPAGRGQPVSPITDSREKSYTRFAHELARHLEQEARLEHFGSLVIFAPRPFLTHLTAALGKISTRLLGGTYEMDLTSVGLAELDRRIQHELEAAEH